MRDKKLPVTYVVYTDEGHGFARPVNRLDFYGRVDEFLARHLGGRGKSHGKRLRARRPRCAEPGSVISD